MSSEKKVKVLIVDDEPTVRKFLTQLLTMETMEVKCAENGSKAVEAAKKENFDLTFLDVKMPKVNGLQTLKQLKKINPDSKYVMMTGYAVDDLLEQAKKEGAVCSIKKPFDINQVKKLADELCRNKSVNGLINILVADDEDVVLNFFKRLLKGEAYNVTTVKTGKEALEIIQGKDFDLVFLDMMLEDIKGIELCAEIEKIKPDLSIILITGYVEERQQTAPEELNIKGYLYKPFEIKKIYEEVNKIKRLKGL